MALPVAPSGGCAGWEAAGTSGIQEVLGVCACASRPVADAAIKTLNPSAISLCCCWRDLTLRESLVLFMGQHIPQKMCALWGVTPSLILLKNLWLFF